MGDAPLCVEPRAAVDDDFLAADIDRASPLDNATRLDLERAGTVLHQSLGTVAAALNAADHGSATYTRASALFDQAERHLEQDSAIPDDTQLAIRGFKLIDGAVAQIAGNIGLPIADYDTNQAVLAPRAPNPRPRCDLTEHHPR